MCNYSVEPLITITKTVFERGIDVICSKVNVYFKNRLFLYSKKCFYDYSFTFRRLKYCLLLKISNLTFAFLHCSCAVKACLQSHFFITYFGQFSLNPDLVVNSAQLVWPQFALPSRILHACFISKACVAVHPLFVFSKHAESALHRARI